MNIDEIENSWLSKKLFQYLKIDFPFITKIQVDPDTINYSHHIFLILYIDTKMFTEIYGLELAPLAKRLLLMGPQKYMILSSAFQGAENIHKQIEQAIEEFSDSAHIPKEEKEFIRVSGEGYYKNLTLANYLLF